MQLWQMAQIRMAMGKLQEELSPFFLRVQAYDI